VLKLPVNSYYTTVRGDENFIVDVNRVFHLLGMSNHLCVILMLVLMC